MEKEQSDGALQKCPVENLRHDHFRQSAMDKYELSSRLTKDVPIKIRKKLSTQDTIPHRQAAVGTTSKTTFSGSVSRCYPARKRSLLKRFKECSFSPCSEEYNSVLQHFTETAEQQEKAIVAEPRRTRNRKISLHEPRRGSKYKTSSNFETELPRSFKTRPRCNTLPSRISVVRTPDFGKTEETGEDNYDTPFRSNVKLAWQIDHDDFGKKEKGIHKSETPPRLYFSNTHKEMGKKVSETSPPCELFSHKDKSRKERQRKKAEVNLPKIEEKLFIDDSQLQAGGAKLVSDEARRKIYTAAQTNVGHELRDFSKKDLSQDGTDRLKRERSCCTGPHSTDKKDTTHLKQKIFHSISSPAGTNYPKASELTSAPLFDLRNDNFQFETFQEKSPMIRRTDQFSITRANIRRVGKATLAATRLLKIHYRENGGSKKDVTITEDHKKLDKLFEEMKDCRYLRQNSSEMRT